MESLPDRYLDEGRKEKALLLSSCEESVLMAALESASNWLFASSSCKAESRSAGRRGSEGVFLFLVTFCFEPLFHSQFQ